MNINIIETIHDSQTVLLFETKKSRGSNNTLEAFDQVSIDHPA